jgi:mRNA-degrading endonuclease RelE of RelBE toxin-antitoxin system
MARLALARDFLPEYASLDRGVRRKVDELFPKFEEHTFAGLHLEKLTSTRDPRTRTVRVDDNYRGIVMAPEQGDTFLLVHVLKHSDADKWVGRNRFAVNVATGALEVSDAVALEDAAAALRAGPPATVPLLANCSEKDLVRLGVNEKLAPLVARIATEAELAALASVLPPGQADALHMLAAGYSVEEAWSELVAGEDPGPVDTADLEAALARPASRSMFYVASGADDLLDILNRPFDLWRTFLHPTQRRLAYRPVYNGPVRVTGGAGTGKTVVAMHRAKALAGLGQGRILFTTFTRNLARAIKDNLGLLGGPELVARVDVLNVDRLAHQVVREAEGGQPRIAQDEELYRLWEDVVDELGLPWTPTFLRQEWVQIVLSQGISSRDAYLGASRPGRGRRLTRRERAEIWRGVEDATNRLVSSGRRTYLQMADAAAGFLAARSVRPYDHVIVDEAQDLHPAQWRMLRAAVADHENDMFIVGDTHQRIYDNRVTLSSVGINVRGRRSQRLHINYRTTHEILAWSLGLLSGQAFDDLDGQQETLAGYRSQFHGPKPTLIGYPTRAAELSALAEAVAQWHLDGVPLSDIGVAARTADGCRQALAALDNAGLEVRLLSGDDATPKGGVEVGTMHRMKGLEYRCVAVVDAGRERVPLPAAVTAASEDEVEHQRDLQRERCLLYVACTRARDALRVTWSGDPSPFLSSD